MVILSKFVKAIFKNLKKIDKNTWIIILDLVVLASIASYLFLISKNEIAVESNPVILQATSSPESTTETIYTKSTPEVALTKTISKSLQAPVVLTKPSLLENTQEVGNSRTAEEIAFIRELRYEYEFFKENGFDNFSKCLKSYNYGDYKSARAECNLTVNAAKDIRFDFDNTRAKYQKLDQDPYLDQASYLDSAIRYEARAAQGMLTEIDTYQDKTDDVNNDLRIARNFFAKVTLFLGNN